MSATYKSLQLPDALRIAEAALKKADELKRKIAVAVVDAGGRLVVFERMDGASLHAIDFAQRKAHTARAFDAETRDLFKRTQMGGDLFGLHDATLIALPGGVPVRQDDIAVGAVGIAGAKPEEDHDIAIAAARAF